MIVLQDGAPVMKNLDRNRITVDELRAAARLEGIARLADVEWAVLETGGRISFIERSRLARVRSPSTGSPSPLGQTVERSPPSPLPRRSADAP